MIKFIIIWNKRKKRIKITWQSQGLDLLKGESLEKNKGKNPLKKREDFENLRMGRRWRDYPSALKNKS